MASFEWQLLPDSPLSSRPLAATTASPPSLEESAKAFLGSGIIRPFVRDKKQDFANSSGVDLVRSAVGQVLGTKAQTDSRSGELPWRTEFGSLIHLLRFRNNDAIFRELARTYVQDALQRWEPRVRVNTVRVKNQDDGQGGFVPVIFVGFNIIDENVPGNNVVLAGGEVAIPVI